MQLDLTYVNNVAIGAAYAGATILNHFLGKLTSVQKKGPSDLVTEADIESEKKIIETLRYRFPDHQILAEESGLSRAGESGCLWIIDPLDGTTNFAHQLPFFSISIAFAFNGELLAGVVLNPVSGELFSAVKDKGATLNGHKIQVTNQEKISESLLVTGFPYNNREDLKPLMIRFENCLKAARGIRRLGSAALDLCFVACGRFDGFWEENLKPWDTAAGMVIAREAGAKVTDFSGADYALDMKEILATNGLIHRDMEILMGI
ncbi:MAG: inositol monophosphatase [Desulfobacterales bacterium]|jgi:myo-inositol-1(or 4)-monophosphatase|nr:inositol monophosphatase [Desulfobacterales bacterium]